MLMSYRNDAFVVPHTSTCIIHTAGTIVDGMMVEVTSPVFASTSFSTRAINLSNKFTVVARVNGSVDSDGNLKGTLVCDDDDVFNMYVKIQ